MIERLRPHRPGERTARRGAPTPHPDVSDAEEPSILGFPAEAEPDDRHDVGPDQTGAGAEGGPDTVVRLVVRRRSDLVAGSALALAGVAANVSLWLPWVEGENQTGLYLLRRAVDAVGSGAGELLRRGLWQPVAIVLCGGVLVLLGLLVLLPAHTHRLVGVLALLVTLAATAAVLALLAAADWDTARFGPGMWSGVAVPGCGLLGALKAMLTLPLVTKVERESGPRT